MSSQPRPTRLAQTTPVRSPATLDNIAAELWQIRQILLQAANTRARVGFFYLGCGAGLLVAVACGSLLMFVAEEQGAPAGPAATISLTMIGLAGLLSIITGVGMRMSEPQ